MKHKNAPDKDKTEDKGGPPADQTTASWAPGNSILQKGVMLKGADGSYSEFFGQYKKQALPDGPKIPTSPILGDSLHSPVHSCEVAIFDAEDAIGKSLHIPVHSHEGSHPPLHAPIDAQMPFSVPPPFPKQSLHDFDDELNLSFKLPGSGHDLGLDSKLKHALSQILGEYPKVKLQGVATGATKTPPPPPPPLDEQARELAAGLRARRQARAKNE